MPPLHVSIQKQALQWQELPVCKLQCFPEGTGPNKPFSQAQFCYQPQVGLSARLWAFDAGILYDPSVSHLPEGGLFSKGYLALALNCQPGSSSYLRAAANPYWQTSISFFGPEGETPVADTRMALFNGEDLQGEYWGFEWLIGNQVLSHLFGISVLESSALISANAVHKRCAPDHTAFASLFETGNNNTFVPMPFLGELMLGDY